MSKSNQQCCRNIIDNTDDNLPSAIQPCKIYVVTKVHASVKLHYSCDLAMTSHAPALFLLIKAFQ